MENVDVVDENLKILHQADKQEAHNRGLLHPTVIAEVINPRGEWLLVKQATHKQDPGQFVSPVGGHIKSGENFDDALRREAQEEVGLTDFKFKFIGKKIYNRILKNSTENHYFIVYEIYSGELPVLNDESVEFKLFRPEKIKKLLKDRPEMFGLAFHFVVNNFYKTLLS